MIRPEKFSHGESENQTSGLPLTRRTPYPPDQRGGPFEGQILQRAYIASRTPDLGSGASLLPHPMSFLGWEINLSEEEGGGGGSFFVLLFVTASMALPATVQITVESGILTNLPLWSRRPNHRACSTKMPPLQSHKRRCVACHYFPDDQTRRLQAGAGEDDIIHLPSGLGRVAC